jgi:hypothetical protein
MTDAERLKTWCRPSLIQAVATLADMKRWNPADLADEIERRWAAAESALAAKDAECGAMLDVLRRFHSHYPCGISPELDSAYADAYGFVHPTNLKQESAANG